jgi:diaminopropionate ammonia-lyase
MGAARIVRNPLADRSATRSSDRRPLRFHRSLPGYQVTPLVDAPGLARELGVSRVLVKDESQRMGMPSFKILGASWATFRALREYLGTSTEEVGTLQELREILTRQPRMTLVAATDGNHGRAVARMASLLELDAQIYVPADMAQPRIDAIEAEGATVTVVDGAYDDAVARSAEDADATHLVISDTSWPGYQDVPRWVIDGYATIAAEIEGQLAEMRAPGPTLVAAQIGVGAFAASVVRSFRGPETTIVGVEPAEADCATASIEAGKIVFVPGPHASIMAGLNCGRPSLVAWPVISRGIDVYVTVEDDTARDAMRLLAAAGVVSGESGAAGLAGLLDLARREGLPPDAEVLTVSTEGATDPRAYEQIVGRSAADVRAGQRALEG